MDDRSHHHPSSEAPDKPPGPAGDLPPAAQRALAEAAARRAELDRRAGELAKAPERDGRGGLDPVRYEDWEIAGRAIDF